MRVPRPAKGASVRRMGMAALAIGTALSLSQAAYAQANADLVFIDGNVIPMTGPAQRAQALAVKDGKIVAVGTDAQISKLRGRNTQVVDLDGKTLLPGFIDAHGHITMVAQRSGMAVLEPPPVGGVSSIAQLQATLAEHAARHSDGWIIGTGYDDAALAEKRHPTRQELDAISATRPVIAWHVSAHLLAMNTKGLEMVGMLHPGKDPDGGVIRREADGKTASGVLEETAMYAALAALPKPTLDVQLQWLKAAQDTYARNGLTTAQDGATQPDGWNLLSEAAKRGELFIDVHALPIAMTPWPGMDKLPFNAPYSGRLRLAGVKLILDGSPQGRTAWLSKAYYQVPHGSEADYSGYQQVPDKTLQQALTRAATHGWQVYAHVNGDAAVQQLIDNVRVVGQQLGKPMQRTIAIHAQTARYDQLQQMKALDIEPSFFASHTFYWGDWHRDVVLGTARAEHISAQRDAIDLGLRPTIHNDSPVVPPDMMRLIWSAVTRRTRSNDILGPDERVTPYEALLEVTANAAYEIHEEARKGTLEPGKLADLVVLDSDPLSINTEKLNGMRVVATIKEGKYVFGAPATP